MKYSIFLLPTYPDILSIRLPKNDFEHRNTCFNCPSADECAAQEISRFVECPNTERLAGFILDMAFPDPNDPRRNDSDLVGYLFEEVVKGAR